MIAYLSGKLAQKGPTHLVVDVGGVGYFVHIPLSSYDRVGEVGEQVQILTYLHVKEDGMELFGFATEEERELFRTLMSVSGVGPKLAQAVLSAMSPEEFRRAVVRNDLGRLTSVPGIGRKTAQRLVLELREKFGEEVQVAPEVKGASDEAFLALLSLGMRDSEARMALAKARGRLGKEASIEELIREALKG
ncbi:MAG TPA: Holliday junction branch migration protein RuvA [Candidatus Latescibacteria bacterium]|nr:Holliday junction branch migration protein RuvA [Candidatus Latescibacterota bacterium]